MSEFANKPAYSAAARRVTEAFAPSSEEFAEYAQRGLIATNNLGLRMQVFEAGPDSKLWQFYSRSLFTPGITERLERARAYDPELWQESVSAYVTRGDLMNTYFSAIQNFGPQDPRTEDARQHIVAAEWHDIELRTKVFEIIDQEPLSEDEAMELCR